MSLWTPFNQALDEANVSLPDVEHSIAFKEKPDRYLVWMNLTEAQAKALRNVGVDVRRNSAYGHYKYWVRLS